MTVELIGFDTEPHAIIFWTKPGDSEPSSKTVCYDEEELQHNLKTLLTWREGYKVNISNAK